MDEAFFSAWNDGYKCAFDDIKISENPFPIGKERLAWNHGFAFFQAKKAKDEAEFKQKCPWVAYRKAFLHGTKSLYCLHEEGNDGEMAVAGKIVSDIYRIYGSYSIANLVFDIRSKFVEGFFKDVDEDACVRVLCYGLHMIKHRWGFTQALEATIKTESLNLRAFIRGENMRMTEYNEFLIRSKKDQDSIDKIAIDAVKNGQEMVLAGKIVRDIYGVYGSYTIANLVDEIKSKFVEGIFKDGDEDACVRVLCYGLEMIKHKFILCVKPNWEETIKTESLNFRAFIRGENMRTAESTVEKARASLCTAIDECSKALAKYHEKL